MKQLSLDALRAFSSVVELQSYTAAGQLLGRSQPAISLQVQRLEDQLGVNLLQRQRGRIQLTSAGQDVYEHARQMLALNDQLLSRFEQPGLSGRVRLGIPSEFASSLLPKVLGQFAQSYPNVTLAVTSSLSKDLLAASAATRFDLVIALQEPTAEPAGKVLRQEALVWVGRQQDIPQPLPLVVAPEGCIYRRRALQSLAASQRASRITYTDADFSGLTAAIAGGLGITVLTQSTVPEPLMKLQSSDLPELGTVNIIMRTAPAEGVPNEAADYLGQYLADYLS